jgi:hypothetical protein
MSSYPIPNQFCMWNTHGMTNSFLLLVFWVTVSGKLGYEQSIRPSFPFFVVSYLYVAEELGYDELFVLRVT